MLVLPVPRLATRVVHRVLRLPPPQLLRLLRDRVRIGTIARTTRTNHLLQLKTARLLHGVNDVVHGGRLSRAQIEHLVPLVPVALHELDGFHVTLRNVHDVDVVPQAGAVGRVVVRAEYVDVVLLPDGHLLKVRNQIRQQGGRILAHIARGVSTDRIEVAEDRYAPLLVLVVHVAEDALHHELGFAVRMLNALVMTHTKSNDVSRRRVFVKRTGSIAIHGAGRGEHYSSRNGIGRTQPLHVVLSHRLQEVDGATQVILVVLKGLALRLSHVLERGEVDDGLDIRIRFKNAVHLVEVQQRALRVITQSQQNVDEVQLSLFRLRHLLDGFKTADSTRYASNRTPYFEFDKLSRIVTS